MSLGYDYSAGGGPPPTGFSHPQEVVNALAQHTARYDAMVARTIAALAAQGIAASESSLLAAVPGLKTCKDRLDQEIRTSHIAFYSYNDYGWGYTASVMDAADNELTRYVTTAVKDRDDLARKNALTALAQIQGGIPRSVGPKSTAARQLVDAESSRLAALISSSPTQIVLPKSTTDRTVDIGSSSFGPLIKLIGDLQDAVAADTKDATDAANAVTTGQGSYKGIVYTLTRKGGVLQSVAVDNASPILAGKSFTSERDAQGAIDQALADKARADAAAALDAEVARNPWTGAEQDAYARANSDFGSSPFASQPNGPVRHWIAGGKVRKSGPQLVDQATLDGLKAQAQSLTGSGPTADPARDLVRAEISNIQGQIDSGARASFDFLRSKIDDLRRALAADAAAVAVATRNASYRGISYTVTTKGGSETGATITPDSAWTSGTQWPTEALAKAAIDAEMDARAQQAAKAARLATIRQNLNALKAKASAVTGGSQVQAARSTFDADAALATAALDQGQEADLTALNQDYTNLVAAANAERDAAAQKQAQDAANAARSQSQESTISDKTSELTQLAAAAAAVPSGDKSVSDARAAFVAEASAVKDSLAQADRAAAAGTSMVRVRTLLQGLQSAYQAYLDAKAKADADAAQKQAAASAASAALKGAIDAKASEVAGLVARAKSIPLGDDTVENARKLFNTEAGNISGTLASGQDAPLDGVRNFYQGLVDASQAYQAKQSQAQSDAAAQANLAAARIKAADDAAKAAKAARIQALGEEVQSLIQLASGIPRGTPAVEQARADFMKEATAIQAQLAAGTLVDTGFLRSKLMAMQGGSGGLLAWLLHLLGIQ